MHKVRIAQPKDADALAKMNREFNRNLIEPKEVSRKLRRGSEIVLIAENEDQVLGFACAQLMDSFCYVRPYAELTELYVRVAYRRKGVGSALVRNMEKELARRGVMHIHILTAVRNKPARALYDRLRYSHSRKRPEMLYDKNMKPKAD